MCYPRPPIAESERSETAFLLALDTTREKIFPAPAAAGGALTLRQYWHT